MVGGGDTAVEEATFLTKFARKVTLIHRRDSLRASKIMRDRILGNPKVEFAWNTMIEEYLGPLEPEANLKGARLRSILDGSTRDLEVDGIFLAIGHVPNSDVYNGQLAVNSEGYLLTRSVLCWEHAAEYRDLLRTMPNYGSATNVEGVFAAGDVVDTHYRQAVTAAGMGCAAAIDCEKWLESQGHRSH